MDVYTKEGPSQHESPYVEIILTLADALERQGDTEGPYPGADLLLEVFTVKRPERELAKTYTAYGHPLGEWTTDPDELVRRMDALPFEEVMDFVERQVESLKREAP